MPCSFLPVEAVPKTGSLSRPVQSRRKPTRRELPPWFTRPAKSVTCPSKEDCSSDEDGDIIFVSRTTKSLSPSAKSFQPQGISLPQTSAKSYDPVSLSPESIASVSNEPCPEEQASFSHPSVKNHAQTLPNVSELSEVQQHENSSGNPASINNETEGVTEQSTETEMPNTCESLDLQSIPARIRREPSRLTYYASGSLFNCNQNSISAQMNNIPPYLPFVPYQSPRIPANLHSVPLRFSNFQPFNLLQSTFDANDCITATISFETKFSTHATI